MRFAELGLFVAILVIHGARGGAVGCGTALQAGRSRFRFPMVSLEYFIDIFLPPPHFGSGVYSTSSRNEDQLKVEAASA
jgi:hypothetical protein